MTALTKYMPIFEALRGYNREEARADILAGLTTAVMLIPQAMGYAMLAGLEPIYGLYAAVLPLIVYGFFGTSRQLAVGPVAMVSLLVAAGVGAIAQGGTEQYIALAVLLALMVGVIQLVMGIGRLGFLVNFLSHPVISGFTSAAALIIGLSQLKHLLGFNIPRSSFIHQTLGSAIANIDKTHFITLGIGVASIAILVVLKKVSPRFPRALAVVVFGSVAVWGLGLHDEGVKIVGDVPDGLPPLALPSLDFAAMKDLFPIAMAISLVGFMESIAVAKKYARQEKYEVDANKELVGLGLANIAGAFTKAYPVTGGFSRTAVNAQAGAKTGVASIITAVVVGVTLLMFTGWFYYLPKAVLAAIIMTAVFGLIDVAEVKHLFHVSRSELAMLLLTFVATLTLGIEEGIGIGVLASVAMLVFRTTRPHVAILGQLPGTTSYRNIDRFEEAKLVPGVLAVRLDAQLYFGNVNFLKETLDRLEKEQATTVKSVVIDASGINRIDASGESAFREVQSGYEERGIELHFANVKGPVRDLLKRSHFWNDMGEARFHLSVHDAVNAAKGAPVPPHPTSKRPEASKALSVAVAH